MFALIPTLMGILIFLLSTPAAMNYVKIGEKQAKAAAAAQQMKAYDQAVAEYVQQYYNTIEAATPATITTAMLESTGFLPSGWNPTNAYGQSYQAYVTQPTAGNLETVVYTTGGRQIDPKTVPLVAGLLGQEGGYTSYGVNNPANELVGAFGGWAVPYTSVLPSWPGSGRLADLLYFNVNGMLSPDYLYRVAIPGQPQLNTMQTALNMGDNNINNSARVAAQDTIIGDANPNPGSDSAERLQVHAQAGDAGGMSMDDPADAADQWSMRPYADTYFFGDTKNTSNGYPATLNTSGDEWVWHNLIIDPTTGPTINWQQYDQGTVAVSTGQLYQAGQACLHAGEIAADPTGALLDCVNGGGTLSWHYPSAHMPFYEQVPIAVGTIYQNSSGYDELLYITSHACSGSIQNISLYLSQSGATWYLVAHDVGYNSNDAGQVSTVVPSGWEWYIGNGGSCITQREATVFELQ